MPTSRRDKPDQRRFLFLQGPHGPFFSSLGRMLRRAGAQVWRVGFNRADQFFWRDAASYIPFRGALEDWPDHLAALLDELEITDIVLYGDTRPVHAVAVARARNTGRTVHVFEEGYLRPHWVTYERGGVNGHSRLMEMSLPDMRASLAQSDIDLPDAPARWGNLREHVFYGALYHGIVLFGNRRYPNFRTHRSLSVADEFRLYLRRLLMMPAHWLERFVATRAIARSGFPYHLVLLQLEHDASFRNHGPFQTMGDFIEVCLDGFREGAPAHHHLVFKAHPLEDDRTPIRSIIRAAARDRGLASRVHFVSGGKLAGLLNTARSAVTVNSTSAQQALWRGLPLKVFGQAVYDKPEFVSTQSLPEFFAEPTRPDTKAYRDYRHFLLETSQIRGGFYAMQGRRELLRQVVDMLLAPVDPYDALRLGKAAPRQQLRAVT